MVIVLKMADGTMDVFETGNYKISKVKDFHPMICKVTVYSNGKRIKTVSRPFSFIYKNFTFKSNKVQEKLKQIQEIENQQIQNQQVEVQE